MLLLLLHENKELLAAIIPPRGASLSFKPAVEEGRAKRMGEKELQPEIL